MFSAGNKYLSLSWNAACWCLLVYIFYCLGDVRGKETDGKYFVFPNYPPLWDTHWLGAVAPPLPWTPSLASPQPDFNSSLSAACIAFNFHFLLQPGLNWVLVTAPALAGELWKAKAAASKWLLQRAGNGSSGWKEPLIVTILFLSYSAVQGKSWRSQPPAVGLLFLLGAAHLGLSSFQNECGVSEGACEAKALPVLKPGDAALGKMKPSRAQSAKDRKQVWDYWHHHPGISPGERWSLSLGVPRLCLVQAWKMEQGKSKGADMNNIWFLLEFGHRFKASEGIPGAFVSYPKTNTKTFPNTFYKLCDCNSPIKNRMSPGQVGCRPSSPEIPGLPSLSSLTFPCSNSGQPFVPGVEHPGGSGTAAFPGAHICCRSRACLPACVSQLALAPSNPPGLRDNSCICEALAQLGGLGLLVTGSAVSFCVAFPRLWVTVLLLVWEMTHSVWGHHKKSWPYHSRKVLPT